MKSPGEGAAALAPGQVLEGKYRIARPLGSGAMGVVYEAYHELLQKAVAVKVLRPEMAGLDEVRDRFEAEARAAAAIGHPNIVSVTDMGRTPEGALYFVMDRLAGETLGERLTRQHQLPVAAVLAVAHDVLAGLEAAHELRLVHRDLKPDNIFLARARAGREVTKILDFGIAKALASAGKRHHETRVGLTVGTPLYMAPEQAIAAPDIDGRADLYSMGVILYQMLAGRTPFDGPDAMSVLTAVMTGTPPPLGSLRPDLPHALVSAVEAAISRDRDNRPATAAAFSESLRAAAAGAPAGHFAALASPVLLDLDGALAPVAPGLAPPPEAPPVLEAIAEPPQEPVPAPASPPDALVLESTRFAPPEPSPPPRSRKVRRWALRLVPLAFVAAAAAVFGPRLAQPLKNTFDQALSSSPRDTALILFDVSPADSRLFLDGVPLGSNPVPLGRGEVHTVNALAEGYEMAVEKFYVDEPKTVRLKLTRVRRRP